MKNFKVNKTNKLSPWFLTTLVAALVGLLLSAIPAAWAEEEVAAMAESQSSPCKGLKPYNNLDELLEQFYINLDSDCIFQMSTAELEKIWGIKILDEERAKPKNYYPLSETEFCYKPYKSAKDAFYIESFQDKYHGRKFKAKITKEYLDKHGTLFPDDKLPAFLQISQAKKQSSWKQEPCIFPNASSVVGDECTALTWKMPFGTIALNNDEIEIKGNSDIFKERPVPTPSVVRPQLSEMNSSFPCRGLKPYNNLDELLYQFYINLDSDCLFKMPVEELEKIWDIKILSKEKAKGEDFANLTRSSDFMGKPYKTDKDAFYIEILHYKLKDSDVLKRNFYINITNQYYEKYATLFPEGNFPKLIPAPLEQYFDGIFFVSSNDQSRRPKITGQYHSAISYIFGDSSNKSNKIVIDMQFNPTRIAVINYR